MKLQCTFQIYGLLPCQEFWLVVELILYQCSACRWPSHVGSPLKLLIRLNQLLIVQYLGIGVCCWGPDIYKHSPACLNRSRVLASKAALLGEQVSSSLSVVTGSSKLVFCLGGNKSPRVIRSRIGCWKVRLFFPRLFSGLSTVVFGSNPVGTRISLEWRVSIKALAVPKTWDFP